MSPCILTPLIVRVVSAGSSSLLAQSVHEKVSPTYALPKASGRLSTGLKTNLSVGLIEGYASEEVGAIPRASEFGIEYWCAKDGRDNLQSLHVSAGTSRDGWSLP
jgi:hypothetical protein